MIQHFYQNIDGWFDFESLYRHVVENAQPGAKFVGIGGARGKAAAFMGVEILNAEKDLQFTVVDTWDWGIPPTPEEADSIRALLGESADISRLNVFVSNVYPVSSVVSALHLDSVSAANQTADNSLAFVFVDGAHDVDSVGQDIDVWLPKLKPDGILAGHDFSFSFPGVMMAVTERFPHAVALVDSHSWVVRLRDGKPINAV